VLIDVTDTTLVIVHTVVCRTCPYPLPQRVLQRVRDSASHFSLQYLLHFLRSSNSCLLLLPLRPVTSIFPSITCFRRLFLHKMWPIQLSIYSFFVCRMFLSCCNCCQRNATHLMHNHRHFFFLGLKYLLDLQILLLTNTLMMTPCAETCRSWHLIWSVL
jgi:hypothetical protein